MKRTTTQRLRFLFPLLFLLLACGEPGYQIDAYNANLAILGDTDYLAPGSEASFLVQVRKAYDPALQPDRHVEVYLSQGMFQRTSLFYGDTGPDGIAQVKFEVPPTLTAGHYLLEVTADGPHGETTTSRDTYVGPTYDVLITPDKPIYQPGQTLHLRALALNTLDLKPAGNVSITLGIQNPDGNRIMRQALTTSEFGIAVADFPLDSAAPAGKYTLEAELGPTVVSRQVEVKPYKLPRFEITFATDKPYYLPGEIATGSVSSQYYFGKPVAGADVTITGWSEARFLNGRQTLFTLTGKTGEDGVYPFTAEMPLMFAGKLLNKNAKINLDISVTDVGGHTEESDETITIADKPLLIDATPESGGLRLGLPNLVYVDISSADGAATPAQLTVTDSLSRTYELATDSHGLGSFIYTPTIDSVQPLWIQAATPDGVTANERVALLAAANDADVNLLLRPDKSEYGVGDTMNVDIFVAGQVPNIYLDIIKGKQTFAMVSLPVVNGIAQAALPIDGKLLGTLELNAYAVDEKGMIARDRRLALVNPAPAEVKITPNAATYKPGDTATLDMQVSRNGAPMPGAVGISIVDESVYALQEVDPGFARTYFLLDREMQDPRYAIYDLSDLPSDEPSPYDGTPDSLQYAQLEQGEQLTATGDAGGRNAADVHQQAKQTALAGALALELKPSSSTGIQAIPPALPAAPWRQWGWRAFLAAPLVGLTFFDRRRKGRSLLIALAALLVGGLLLAACAGAAPAPPSEPAPAAESADATSSEPAAPRVRQIFPETLYWMPELKTDAQGRVEVDVPIADSITTWRISVLASDANGNLGSADAAMPVFQDFFIEPDLPRFLTVGDEIAAPVTVYNYSDKPQTVTLVVTPDDWFELVDTQHLTVTVTPNAVSKIFVPIRATRFGDFELEIVARGGDVSDAVRKAVQVAPKGQRIFDVYNGPRLSSSSTQIVVPDTATPGTGRLTLKLYPSVPSTLADSLAALLQAPHGCFEQTTSATFPNVLILTYLSRQNVTTPATWTQAWAYIDEGYQALLTFEVANEPGGFSLWGEAPADLMLTAYGLQEFTEMAKVRFVDPALMQRMANFLAARQQTDGAWESQWEKYSGVAPLPEGRLLTTAYMVWTLADSGYGDDATIRRGIDYLEREGLAQLKGAGANAGQVDNQLLALLARALQAGKSKQAQKVLDRLAAQSLALGTAGDEVHWPTTIPSFMGSWGDSADVETTALAIQALQQEPGQHTLVESGINYLMHKRDAQGGFYTTRAAVEVLRAFVKVADETPDETATTVDVSLTDTNGAMRTETVVIDDANADLMHAVSFADVVGANVLSVTVTGGRKLDQQAVTEYYLPSVANSSQLRVDASFDHAEIVAGETIEAQATVEWLDAQPAGTVVVELALPPGLAPDPTEFDSMVAHRTIQRYEIGAQRVVLYLQGLHRGEPKTFRYHLRALYPVRADVPAVHAYDYYNPERQSTSEPQRITISLGTPEN